MADDKLSIYRQQEVAARYDERWRGSRGRARDLRKQRAVARALESLGPIRSVLDVPCGTGRFTAFLRDAAPSYVGADAAEAMLREARGKHANATFVAADLTRLPFADRSFDVAVCIRLMHLIRDASLRRRFLTELARVSREGVVVDFRQDRALRVWLGRARANLGLRHHAPGALPLATIEADLAAAGLIPSAQVPVPRLYLSDKLVIAAVHAT